MTLRIVYALPVLLAAWLAILAVVLRTGGPAPAVLVPFPPAGLMASLGQDISLTAATSISLTLQSDAPDLVDRVYRAGAWLVLPAGLDGCMPRLPHRAADRD